MNTIKKFLFSRKVFPAFFVILLLLAPSLSYAQTAQPGSPAWISEMKQLLVLLEEELQIALSSQASQSTAPVAVTQPASTSPSVTAPASSPVASANTSMCNGVSYTTTCPSGYSWSCSTSGGLCSPIETNYQPPATTQTSSATASVPATPPAAEQTATCQQEYSTALAADSVETQQTEATENTAITNDQQTISQLADNGVAMSGEMGQAQQELSASEANLASTKASAVSEAATLENTLQQCLAGVSQ